MNKLLLVCLFLLTVSKTIAQSISNPLVDSSDESDLVIMDIVWLSGNTAVHFAYANTKDELSEGPYIYLASPGNKGAMFIVANGKRYNLIKTEGIANVPKKLYVEPRRVYEFTAYFQKLPYGLDKISLLEGDAGSWNFHGIHLYKPDTVQPQTNQTTSSNYSSVKMEKEGGIYLIPCKVNGLPLKFVFDTGASDVSISITEAIFMLKNDFLSKDDIGEKAYYRTASGSIVAGTKILIRSLEIGGKVIHNVEASVANQRDAPLLLGQSALSKIGRFEFDFDNSRVKFFDNAGDYTSSDSNYSGSSKNNADCVYETGFDNPSMLPPLRETPSLEGILIYSCPRNARVCILEKSSGIYYRVRVNGRVGYVSKGFLISK